MTERIKIENQKSACLTEIPLSLLHVHVSVIPVSLNFYLHVRDILSYAEEVSGNREKRVFPLHVYTHSHLISMKRTSLTVTSEIRFGTSRQRNKARAIMMKYVYNMLVRIYNDIWKRQYHTSLICKREKTSEGFKAIYPRENIS